MKQRLFTVALLAVQAARPQAFTTPARIASRRPFETRWAATTEDIEAVTSMRAGEIKKELESYGISTVSFLEKSELVDALVDARAKGLKPKEKNTSTSSSSNSSCYSSTSPSTSAAASEDSRPRDVRLKEEMEKLKDMKAGDMKKELEERGISTASFFEKTEFLKALAEARVDNVQDSGKKKKKRRSSDEEDYAEYADVEVITDDSAGPRQKQSSSSGGSGGSPFGGGAEASPFGGGTGGMRMEDLMGAMGGGGGMPGGMGGIADMLKNLGMGGGAGAAGGSPFGGMGGMGDMMGKAQQMMKNPKVMELMTKAQSNPKFMKAMQECMSNPAAFAKYRNDPEISELVRELEQYM